MYLIFNNKNMRRVTVSDYPTLKGKKVKLDQNSSFYGQSKGSIYGVVDRVTDDSINYKYPDGNPSERWIRVIWYGINEFGKLVKKRGTDVYPSFQLYFYEEEKSSSSVFDF